MSFEYSIALKGAPDLGELAECLRGRGFLFHSRNATVISAILPGKTPADVAKWGGDVEICLEEGHLRVMMTCDGHQEILEALIEALKKRDIFVDADEP